jgi:serine/threonine protein kinase
LIRPEHILESGQSGRFLLTNFSVILAGDAQQLIAGIEPQRLSAYAAPEFGRELIDGRSDVYSLLATAYHAVTGSVPAITGGVIPQAQRLNPNVSRQFDAILSKGLHPNVQQRYQRPSELRQDILSMRSVPGSIAAPSNVPTSLVSAQRFEAILPVKNMSAPKTTSDDVSQLLPNMMAAAFVDDIGDSDAKTLLPTPEALSPMPESNDMLFAGIWIAAILLFLIVLVALSRGFA